MIQSFIIAFSMYSKVPMPRVEWSKKNIKYAFCFFPFVGVVLGVIVYGVASALKNLLVSDLCFASIMTVLPVLYTGGIHVDGLLDTLDALNSYADREKKLEILKDPHTGAFAIIGGITYFLITLGMWSEIKEQAFLFLAVGYILTRALSGFSVVTFPLAKNTGLAATFSDCSHRSLVRGVMIAYCSICILALLSLDVFVGAGVIIISLLVFLYHYYICRTKFGGITGDLAGYYLQLNECAILIWLVVAGYLVW